MTADRLLASLSNAEAADPLELRNQRFRVSGGPADSGSCLSQKQLRNRVLRPDGGQLSTRTHTHRLQGLASRRTHASDKRILKGLLSTSFPNIHLARLPRH